MQETHLPPRTAPGRSCVACKRRKIRCNREEPCSYCTKLGLQCAYPNAKQSEKERCTDDVMSRLQRIELLLERLDAKASISGSTSAQSTGDATPLDHGPLEDTYNSHRTNNGKLVLEEGDERFVSGSFWADLDATEEKDVRPVEPNISIPEYIPSVIANVFPGPRNVFLRSETEAKDLHQLHPSGGVLLSLWQVFVEGVDPVLKILHIPVTQRQLFWASQHLTEIPPAFESLMFAIYFAAVTTVQRPTCCLDLFQEDRQTLLRRYRLGVEEALAKANFMSRPNVTTIQALTMFLICARVSTDKGYIWSMVGLLIRLAMKLGLHRDPAELRISPFMSEMRRRLWWQIYVLDIRTAEDSDMDPFICDHIYNTHFPTNINDADLDTDMKHAVTNAQHRTEMLFTLLRVEVSYAAQKIVFSSNSAAGQKHPRLSLKVTNKFLQEFVANLQDKYFKYCDPQVPICFLAETATRMIVTKMKLTLYHPAQKSHSDVPTETLQDLVVQSIEIIEGVHILRTHDKYARWVWLFEKYVDWDAVAFLLNIISVVPSSVPLERAWDAIDVFFLDWKDRVTDSERWRRLEGLLMKASVSRSTPFCMLLRSDGDALAPTMKSHADYVGLDTAPLMLGPEVDVPPCHTTNESAATGEQSHIDWNFDNFLLAQDMPSWAMAVDGDPLL
ncbi:hypothetical protein K504DRAFT_387062 [Pleomassaria siparia CBS 279.74]|uniref:Zn(2)-C6 fungal-type domain-containing protein n=1 Tax=Pleomassaria siparia CBS 279.74 TaxID=1314801 RepID=A0A6G1K0I5_9PLEO|nr:hypothetical protein K504DRAFT_387062 [Pleomassaria siparia CBS 279.74]